MKELRVLLDKLRKRVTDPRSGGSLVGDASGGAVWIAKALTRSGYGADFSLDSLRELDRFFDEQAADGQPVPGGLLSQQLGQWLFCLGAYCGEIVRRQRGGTWKPADERDREAEINLALGLPDGSVLWPVQRVMKRFQLGREESLYAYAAVCGGCTPTERN